LVFGFLKQSFQFYVKIHYPLLPYICGGKILGGGAEPAKIKSWVWKILFLLKTGLPFISAKKLEKMLKNIKKGPLYMENCEKLCFSWKNSWWG